MSVHPSPFFKYLAKPNSEYNNPPGQNDGVVVLFLFLGRTDTMGTMCNCNDHPFYRAWWVNISL